MSGPGSRSNLDPRGNGGSSRRGQEEGQQDVGGTCERLRVAVRLRLRVLPLPPHTQLPPGPARRALVGSLGAPLALSHTCTVARQLGRSSNTSAAGARTVFSFPGCSKSLLRSCRRVAFGFSPQRYHTAHTSPSPAPSPAVSRQTCLGFTPGGPGRSSQFPHFGKVILRGAGDCHRRPVHPGGPPKVGKRRLQSQSPLDNFGMATDGVRGEVWTWLLALHTGELSEYFPNFSLCLRPSQCLAHL